MASYFVYTHIRLDTNQIFYIGVGTFEEEKKTFKSRHRRAYDKYGRSKYWKNIVKHVNGNYIVNVIEKYYPTRNAAFQQEVEMVKTIGRRDLGLGSLVNLTDGGDGGINPSAETRKKLSDLQKERMKDPEYKRRVAESKKNNPITSYMKGKTWEETFGEEEAKRMKENLRENNLNMPQEKRDKISKTLTGRKLLSKHVETIRQRALNPETHPLKGKGHSEKTKKKLSEKLKGRKVSEETRQKLKENSTGIVFTDERKQKISNSKKKPILQFTLSDEFIREFESQKEAIEVTGIKSIYDVLVGRHKHAGGFKWRFKNS
jgi:hypothetical protein